MGKLEFDSERHLYFLDGVPLDSVTQILQKSGYVDDRWFTDEARERGKAVHETIRLIRKGTLDWSSVKKEIDGYIEAFCEFENDTQFIALPEFSERRMYNPIYRYAGTIDDLGLLNGSYALIDYKTGDSSSANVQTAAYLHFPEVFAYQPTRYSVKLNKDGTYKLKKYTDNNKDFLTFLECLNRVNNK